MGAWIETEHRHNYLPSGQVAPYVGAWIETMNYLLNFIKVQSHPMWVRGLKPVAIFVTKEIAFVAPYVGAWIETD